MKINGKVQTVWGGAAGGGGGTGEATALMQDERNVQLKAKGKSFISPILFTGVEITLCHT